MKAFIKELGWSFLRLALGIPTMLLVDFLIGPLWMHFSTMNLLPLVSRYFEKPTSEFVIVAPLLVFALLCWWATIKLTEQVFGFRFPD